MTGLSFLTPVHKTLVRRQWVVLPVRAQAKQLVSTLDTHLTGPFKEYPTLDFTSSTKLNFTLYNLDKSRQNMNTVNCQCDSYNYTTMTTVSTKVSLSTIFISTMRIGFPPLYTSSFPPRHQGRVLCPGINRPFHLYRCKDNQEFFLSDYFQ